MHVFSEIAPPLASPGGRACGAAMGALPPKGNARISFFPPGYLPQKET